MTRARPMLEGLIALVLAGACAHSPSAPSDAGAASPTVPVEVGRVERKTLDIVVSAPGRTTAIEAQVITAPFDGVLRSLTVTDGDHVRTGQVVGAVVSIDTVAAIAGAEQMLRAARTPGERADAERALRIARQATVAARLRVPETGVVLSHAAAEGDRVTLHQEIVKVAATDSIVFVADVVQTDLSRVRPGERATIDVASRGPARSGVVHDVLPTASSADFTAPVRLDLSPPAPDLTLGLFGTAHIVVGSHPDATVVPSAAVLHDDVTGISRIALVDATDHAHWVDVTPGTERNGSVEIVHPALAEGQRVVVGGVVGLPEGAAVKVRP